MRQVYLPLRRGNDHKQNSSGPLGTPASCDKKKTTGAGQRIGAVSRSQYRKSTPTGRLGSQGRASRVRTACALGRSRAKSIAFDRSAARRIYRREQSKCDVMRCCAPVSPYRRAQRLSKSERPEVLAAAARGWR